MSRRAEEGVLSGAPEGKEEGMRSKGRRGPSKGKGKYSA